MGLFPKKILGGIKRKTKLNNCYLIILLLLIKKHQEKNHLNHFHLAFDFGQFICTAIGRKEQHDKQDRHRSNGRRKYRESFILMNKSLLMWPSLKYLEKTVQSQKSLCPKLIMGSCEYTITYSFI